MAEAAFLLILSGGVLTLAGLALGTYRAWSRLRALGPELDDLLTIVQSTGGVPREERAETQARMKAQLRQRSTLPISGAVGGKGNFVEHVAQIAVLRDALAQLRGPLMLVGLGTVTSTVGGLLALAV